MGEQADEIRAPGLEDESPPPRDSAGEGTKVTDVEVARTDGVRLSRETVEKAARSGLELIGNYYARTNGDERLKFNVDELDTGATIWTDVVEAFFPDWIIPPKWAAAFSAGMWTFACHKARQPIFEEMRKRQAERQQRGKAAQAELDAFRQAAKQRQAESDEDDGEDEGADE